MGVEEVRKDDTARTFEFLFRFNRVWINSRLLLLLLLLLILIVFDLYWIENKIFIASLDFFLIDWFVYFEQIFENSFLLTSVNCVFV